MTMILWVLLGLTAWCLIGWAMALLICPRMKAMSVLPPAEDAEPDAGRGPDLDRLNDALEVITRPWVGR
jgi:hypothetical protein